MHLCVVHEDTMLCAQFGALGTFMRKLLIVRMCEQKMMLPRAPHNSSLPCDFVHYGNHELTGAKKKRFRLIKRQILKT